MRNPQDVLKRRPAIHILYRDCFLQALLTLQCGVVAIPLKPAEPYLVGYIRDYLSTIDAPFDEAGLSNTVNYVEARSVGIVVVFPIDLWTTIDDVRDKMVDLVAQIESVLSWATGNQLNRIGSVVLGPTPEETYCSIDVAPGDHRTRLGFGNTISDFESMLGRMISSQAHDEQFRFALSMVRDAVRENNIQLRIARYFNCLEGLANRLKTKEETETGGSRDAVRKLIGLTERKIGIVVINGRKFEFDAILVAGKLRDHLYHGVIFKPDPKNHEKDSFDLLELHPAVIEDSLRSYCENELARWANGTSNGLPKEASH